MELRSYVITATLLCTAGAVAQDYAAWKKVNKDGSWTRKAEQGVAATALATEVPRDIGLFCPAYEQLDSTDRTRFWVALLSAMAGPESNYKPETTYLEPDIKDGAGKNVTSRGLLQISMESANQGAYACGIQKAEDLHDVATNLACGAKIMHHWVKTDGLIAAQDKPAVGAARYWSVLRKWRNHLPQLSGFTKALPGCTKS